MIGMMVGLVDGRQESLRFFPFLRRSDERSRNTCGRALIRVFYGNIRLYFCVAPPQIMRPPKTCPKGARQWRLIVLILEIPSLPAVKKLFPRYGAEDVHGRALADVVGLTGLLAEIKATVFRAGAGNGLL